MMTESEGLCCKRGFFRIVAGLCEKLSSHVLNIASFEFLPKWQMMKQETHPFLLISSLLVDTHNDNWTTKTGRGS